MHDSVLSARRAPPGTETDHGLGVDEPKPRKQNAADPRSLPPAAPYAAVAVVFFLLGSAFSGSRSVRFGASSQQQSSYPPGTGNPRGGGVEGLVSDFGSLGVPWCRSKLGKIVEWTTKDLLKGLEEFVPIYKKRPIKNNMYGMGFDHSFGLWFMTRWLKPDLMIESGAFKGHSTWVLRQAMPDKPIISLSPRHPEKYLRKGPAYVDKNCTYYAGKEFVDFGSVDWHNVMKEHGISDLSKVVIFFDDHQNELKRLKQALNAGFRNLIFEDNYDTGTGDHYSLRQICDQFYIRGGGHSCFKDSDEARIRMKRKKFWNKAVTIDELCGKGEAWWGVRGEMRDDFNHSNQVISYAEHFQNSRFLESVLEVYWELPPVAGPVLTHQTRYDPARSPDPIIPDGQFDLFRRLGLTQLEASVFNGYTQMVHIQVAAL